MHIGQIGCGRWGAHILRDLRALGADVSVVARTEQTAGRARAGGAKRVVPNIAELGPVDGLIVCTTTASHYEVLLELRSFFPSTPIFCEKVLTPSLSHAEELLRIAGEQLFVMDKWRYHPGVEELAAIARSGRFGPVSGIQTTRLGTGSPHTDIDPIWILMPHDLSIVLEICGRVPEPRAASVESFNGAIWGMTAFLGEKPWVECRVSACAAANQRSVRVFFDNVIFELSDAYSEELKILHSRGGWNMAPGDGRYPIQGAAKMPLKNELEVFLTYLSGSGKPPKSSAAEAVEVVRAIEQLRRLAGIGEKPWRR